MLLKNKCNTHSFCISKIKCKNINQIVSNSCLEKEEVGIYFLVSLLTHWLNLFQEEYSTFVLKKRLIV